MEMSNRRNFLKKVAVAATSAIVAPELLQAATKAESALSQTAATQGAGNLIVPKEGGLRITGTFLDEISHDIPHQNWGAKEWEADFRHMKAIGIDTVIVIRSGYRKFITYPSPYLLKQGCYMPSLDLIDLFRGGFSTGHGFLREPNDIQSYAALACIALQSNQNDQHGGQSIVNFDYGLAVGVAKTFRRKYVESWASACELPPL